MFSFYHQDFTHKLNQSHGERRACCGTAAQTSLVPACCRERQTGIGPSAHRHTKRRCEELRLRVEQPMQIVVGESEQRVGESVFHSAEIKDTLERAAEYSLHTCADSLRQGFLTMCGGHRVGVCGQTAVQDGAMLSFRSISSLNIRIARQIKAAASPELLRQIRDGTHLHNTLFLSPPGWGKTTLLRDIARQLADAGVRTAVADERAELAALYHGVPQFDIGRHTDVIDGCPKAQAAMMLVKTMSPQLLLLDEITSEADIYAAECARTLRHGGVRVCSCVGFGGFPTAAALSALAGTKNLCPHLLY